MLEYPSFIYLQNQKTGCTFVTSCVKQFCAETPIYSGQKHAMLKAAPGKFCFINVREPLALYRSLYAYGLEGKGEIFLRLEKLGQKSLYVAGKDGFAQWLDGVTRAKNAQLWDDRYTPDIAKLIGPMTWRYLCFACPGFRAAAQVFKSIDDIKSYAARHNVINKVLRQERLREDMKSLIQNELAAAFPDQGAVLRWLDETPPINASEDPEGKLSIPAALLKKVLDKEKILYKSFYKKKYEKLKAWLQSKESRP